MYMIKHILNKFAKFLFQKVISSILKGDITYVNRRFHLFSFIDMKSCPINTLQSNIKVGQSIFNELHFAIFTKKTLFCIIRSSSAVHSILKFTIDMYLSIIFKERGFW